MARHRHKKSFLLFPAWWLELMAFLTSQLNLYYNSNAGTASHREIAICLRLEFGLEKKKKRKDSVMTLYMWDIAISLEDLRDSSRTLVWAWTHSPSKIKRLLKISRVRDLESKWDFRLLGFGHCKNLPHQMACWYPMLLCSSKIPGVFNGCFISLGGVAETT